VPTCNDDEGFAFEKVAKGSEYTYDVTGPEGEFSADGDFRNANTAKITPLPGPPGKKTLPNAPGKTHVVTIAITLVTACEVTVTAECDGKKYCRKIAGKPGVHPLIVHVLRMAA
jgi:hypothetical protein